MGAYKGDAARYDMVSSRVTAAEYDRIRRYAQDRELSVSDAVRSLINSGLEVLHAEHSVSDV